MSGGNRQKAKMAGKTNRKKHEAAMGSQQKPNRHFMIQDEWHPVPIQFQSPSASIPFGAGNTPLNETSVGQKRSIEALGTSSPLSSKRQISGGSLDQSIEEINDVTEIGGINLLEEEEKLLSGPKGEHRAPKATQTIVQEEEWMILQEIPLRDKLKKIMASCGIKYISHDFIHCLSLGVEERMRGLICNLIRVAKQRVDIENSRHQTLITSDLSSEILTMNQKAKEAWERKEAKEAAKLENLYRANNEKGANMQATSGTVGGDDMLLKCQLMAEQARQKREGGMGAVSGGLLTSERTVRNSLEAKNRDFSAASSGTKRIIGRNPVIMPQTKAKFNITVKDVITVLERDPQMSKSVFFHRLFERMYDDTP